MLAGGPQAEDLISPLPRVMGVGRQQQQMDVWCFYGDQSSRQKTGWPTWLDYVETYIADLRDRQRRYP